MTEFTPDELASAYVDGEVTPEERALVEGDRDLLARVEEMRRARDALAGAAIEPLSPDARETAIRAAIAAGGVDDLEVARARRVRARLALQVVSVAAAIIVVLVVAGALLIALSGSSGDTKSSTAAGAGSSSASDATAAAAAGAAGTNRDAAPAADAFAPLGSFSDEDSLVNATRTAVDGREKSTSGAAAATSPFAASASSRCTVTGPPGTADTVLTAAALYQDRPVQIDVFRLTDDTLRLVVTDSSTCATAFSRAL